MSEKDKQAIIDAAERLQRGIEDQLEKTAETDGWILQEHAEMYGQSREQATAIMQAQHRQALRNIRANPQFVAKLKSRGLTPEKFMELEQQSPGAYAEAYSKGEDNYLDMLQGKGRKSGDPFYDVARIARPSSEQSARAKKAAKKGKGTDADMDAVLGALMGFDD